MLKVNPDFLSPMGSRCRLKQASGLSDYHCIVEALSRSCSCICIDQKHSCNITVFFVY